MYQTFLYLGSPPTSRATMKLKPRFHADSQRRNSELDTRKLRAWERSLRTSMVLRTSSLRLTWLRNKPWYCDANAGLAGFTQNGSVCQGPR